MPPLLDNPLAEDRRLKYAVAFDDHSPVPADMLPMEFAAGESRHWSESVMNNVHTSTTQHPLTAGMHTLRFYVLDTGLVLQKLALSRKPLPCSISAPGRAFARGDWVLSLRGLNHKQEYEKGRK